jgi:predicted transcriptional regulator
MTTRTTTLSVKLPASLGARLAATATRRRVDKSSIVRAALAAALAREPGSRARAFAEVARDLAGCVSGPVDLSSDARHLRGYGR